VARYFEFPNGGLAYCLERSEEVVLIDGYLTAKAHTPPDQQWPNEFHLYYFTQGKGVAASFVDRINHTLGRIGKPTIVFAESNVFEYGRNPDRMFKATERAKIRDELLSLPPEARERVVAASKAEAALLPPPHMNYREYAARQRQLQQQSDASRAAIEDRARKQSVVNAALAAQGLTPQDIVDLYMATDDPALRDQLLAQLTVPEVMKLIPKVENPDLRNALIRRVLTRVAPTKGAEPPAMRVAGD